MIPKATIKHVTLTLIVHRDFTINIFCPATCELLNQLEVGDYATDPAPSFDCHTIGKYSPDQQCKALSDHM